MGVPPLLPITGQTKSRKMGSMSKSRVLVQGSFQIRAKTPLSGRRQKNEKIGVHSWAENFKNWWP